MWKGEPCSSVFEIGEATMTRAVLIPLFFAVAFAFSLSISTSATATDCYLDCKSKYTECDTNCFIKYDGRTSGYYACRRTICIPAINDCEYRCRGGTSPSQQIKKPCCKQYGKWHCP